MQPGRMFCTALIAVAATLPAVAMTRSHRGPTSPKSHSKSSSSSKHSSGQRSIDDGRATQIQQALVKSGYMTETTGHWDPATESAMQKFQSDNGWQTKLMPDSRAIIKLGLGPSQNNQNSASSGLAGGASETASNMPASQQ